MAAMNTRSGRNHNEDPNDNVVGMADLLTRILSHLEARRPNDGVGTSNNGQGGIYKTFMAGKLMEFYGTEGAIGLLSWFENVESKLSITKCAEGDKVELSVGFLQGRALTWWNNQLRKRSCKWTSLGSIQEITN